MLIERIRMGSRDVDCRILIGTGSRDVDCRDRDGE